MTVLPALAKTAPVVSPPQTFVLTKDGACSITSDKLFEQFRVPGIIKGFTYYDILWSARWDTTGCKLPMFVQVTFNYLNSQKEVVLTRYWSIEVPKEHFVARGELSEKTQVTVQVGSVRLMKIQLETEEQYNAAHQKP
jgi:hypothetical protein